MSDARSLVVPTPDGEAGAVLVAAPYAPDQHPALAYLTRLAPGSRRTMRGALETIAAMLPGGHSAVTLPWHLLRYQHTQAIRAGLAERYAPATANKLLAALKGTLREAWRLGLVPVEDYRRAVDLAPIKGTTLPRGRALRAGELRALFAVCAADDTPAVARDAALLAILYGAGLRRAEVVALDVADYEPDTGALTVRAGKGRKARTVYVTGGAVAAVARWLALRAAADAGAGPLFLPVTHRGKILHRRLTDQTAYEVLRRRAEAAGVAEFSPHDLRRTFISDLLDAGADIATVQKLAGHTNVQTTARYDRRGEATKRQAAGLLHIAVSS